MKNLRRFGVAGVAAIALMAFAASSASATALYNGATKLGVGAKLDFSLKSGTKLIAYSPEWTPLVYECSGSTLRGEITTGGAVGKPARVTVTEASWTGCSYPTTTYEKGALEINWTSGTEASVAEYSGMRLAITSVQYGLCTFGAAPGVTLGALKTSSSGAATLEINTVTSRFSGIDSYICPAHTNWTATYIATEPTNLRVENE